MTVTFSLCLVFRTLIKKGNIFSASFLIFSVHDGDALSTQIKEGEAMTGQNVLRDERAKTSLLMAMEEGEKKDFL